MIRLYTNHRAVYQLSTSGQCISYIPQHFPLMHGFIMIYNYIYIYNTYNIYIYISYDEIHSPYIFYLVGRSIFHI